MKFSRKQVLQVALGALSMIVVPGAIPTPTAAQQAQIVHYAGANTKFPDLAGTLVAIRMNGFAEDEAKVDFMKKHGVRDFSQGNGNPCLVNRAIICLWSEKPSRGVPISASSYSSAYGGSGGVNAWGSGSGEEYFVTIHMDLYTVDQDGNYHITQLAAVTAGGFAGQSSDSVSSYDRHGSGSYYETAGTPEEVAVGTAMHNAITVLLDKKWYRSFTNPNTEAEVFPGAADAVREAFGNRQ